MKANKTGKVKKPIYKRWWFWLLILLLAAGGTRSVSGTEKAAPAVTDAPAVTTASDPVQDTSETAAATTLVFTISSAEAGEYGKQITLNAGTANESSFYGFYIPAGEYTASNIDQKSAVQLTFCKDGTAINDDGIEEIIPSEQRPIVLTGGQSAQFSISDGEYIKLSDDTGNVLLTKE